MRSVVVALFLASLAAAQSRPPHLLLNPDDFARIERRAASESWVAAVRAGIIQSAGNWPASQIARYGLKDWALPPEGGQWTLWYVCPTHGVKLQNTAPGQNRCPVDNRNFTGWPYDQVIYAYRHSDNASAARDNGLAYRLTGQLDYANAAAKILLAYAGIYAQYPIHDTNNKLNATSGGRMSAQTLDEAGWLIPIAWAYDLIADSPALDAAQRAHIEQDLLRAAVAVIGRNDAGMSNWQSWHNTAIAAVGYTLDDRSLISKAVDGKSGFRYQMSNSVFDDGLWYEGAWGYHFFALDPLVQLAEMAARDGADLFSVPGLRKMFDAPVSYSLPDWSLAPFNDSGVANVLSYARLYETAFKRYGDPLFAAVLSKGNRGRESLFWGAGSLPDGAPPVRATEYFPASGNVVLRAQNSDHNIIFKFGPHGGWHGHYDKLNFISYARGGIMAVDPGTQSYAAPTHTTWDKVTLAHNTVVVDEKSQAEATGSLKYFLNMPWVAAATADAGPAYKQASLERTLILTADYAIDIFNAKSLDGAPHQFDWIYHNYGALSTGLALQPYSSFPKSEGYQHLTETQAVTTGDYWQVDFDMNGDLEGNYGAIYTNKSTIRAAYQYSREQAYSGAFSGKLSYDFSADQGYILFTTPTLANQPSEMPLGVSLWIYGDGSGHKLSIRFYDSTDERFVYSVGPLDWTGWRLITASNPESWTHYLGDEDGKFDLPLKSVSVELYSVTGAPVKGALYIDEVAVDYTAAGRIVAADFERQVRNLRLTMAGAPNTTVVTGLGLGPDLLKPVPFVMARRTGTQARFVALLQPYGDAPKPKTVETTATGAIRVEAKDFTDEISLETGYCPITVTRYFKDKGRPGVTWNGCRPGKFAPRKP